MAKTQVDTWFCMDMIFSSYKILIILYQSKKCDQDKHRLPHQTVDISRKSIEMFQSSLGSTLHAYWGIRYAKSPVLLEFDFCATDKHHKCSLILLHQFIPFFILGLDIIVNPERVDIEKDLTLVTWISDHVEKIVAERAELTPVMIIMKAMITACNQVTTKCLASSMTGIAFAGH